MLFLAQIVHADVGLHGAGVKWFEVDMKDVMAAKNKRLQLAGAQTQPQQDGYQFPLKAASYSNFSADLNRRQGPVSVCV